MSTPEQKAADSGARPPFGPGRTIRYAVREAWDSLGLVTAASLTLFLALPIPVYAGVLASKLRVPLIAVLAPALAAGVLITPLYCGICWMANAALDRDEPSYVKLWEGFRRLYGRAALLGLVQAAVTAVIVVNALFYLSRGGFGGLLLGVLFLYLLLFWAMAAIYQAPLLVAGEAGLLLRDGSGAPGVGSALRNSLLLALSAPGYSLAITLFAALIAAPLTASGVGLALLLPGLTAFLGMQAVRDHLVRFGQLAPPPELDAPARDDVWRMRG